MGTVMEMLMVTHMEVMGMEDRVSPETTFLKATLLASESSHLMALRWEATCFLRTNSLFSLRAFFKGETEFRRRRKGSREVEEAGRRKHRAQRWARETSEF